MGTLSDYVIEKAKAANAFKGADPNSNFVQNYGTYSPPGANYLEYPKELQGRLNASGFVAPKRAPNTVFYDPSVGINTTKGHEAAHLQQELYDPVKRREELKHNISPTAVGNYRAHKDLMEQMANFLGNGKQAKVTNLNLDAGEGEMLAELQGVESTLPAGSNVFDAAKLRNETNQRFIRQLEQSMMPNHQKFFPADSFQPVPHAQKPDTSWIQQLQQLMRNFTK